MEEKRLIDAMWDDSPIDVTTEINFIWSIANKLCGIYQSEKYIVVFMKDAEKVDFVVRNEESFLKRCRNIPVPVLNAFLHMPPNRALNPSNGK